MLYKQEILKKSYLENKRDRLKHLLYSLNHFELPNKLSSANHPMKEILLYLYAYKWLRENVDLKYYEQVLSVANNETYAFLVELMVHAADETQFLSNYIAYCIKPENIDKAPHNIKARIVYEELGSNIERTVEAILMTWNQLGYLPAIKSKLISDEAKRQKQIFNNIGGTEDRKRLKLIDELPDSYAIKRHSEFAKLAIVPSFRCKSRCRHCMFLWRPVHRQTLNPGKLYSLLNPLTKNLLFTGGDLTVYLDDFYNAVETMDHIQTFAILLNGAFAGTKEQSNRVFKSIAKALRQRKAKGFPSARVLMQISFDEFHQEVHADSDGNFYERLPIRNIANILESALPYEYITVALLHKQNAYNFSDALFKKGVFYRLAEELEERGNPIKIISIGKSQRPRQHPVTRKTTLSMIADVHFVLSRNPQKVFLMNSSLVDSIGGACFLDPGEYVKAEGIKKEALTKRHLPGEAMDMDLMFWLDGQVTSFSLPFLTWGNLFEDSLETILTRYKKDPLAHALQKFDTRLLDYYRDIAEDFDVIYQNSSSHVNLFYNILSSSKVRLRLTEWLINESRRAGRISASQPAF